MKIVRNFLPLLAFILFSTNAYSQKISEILGRPTDKSITVNLLIDTTAEVYIEWGPTSNSYTQQTKIQVVNKGLPLDIELENLIANTKYFYRTRYKPIGSSDFKNGIEHYFSTQKPKGAAFDFVIQADPHMDENSDSLIYDLCMKNQYNDHPDFMIDLGDIFMSDKLPNISYKSILERVLYMRPFYDLSCHSTPLFVALGNHEGEWGYSLNGTEDCITVWDTKLRKLYCPNPYPNQFYTGDETDYPFQGVRENYYSFEWGDALFVILDPFYYTNVKQANNRWNQTLGLKQYYWFKTTLENSKAKFKFVFSHNLVGGAPSMRGGTEYASLFEWGGLNEDGTPGFAKNRPGWYKPIHDIMAENNVTIFFHGHDHFYAKQDLDCVVYQLVPQPSFPVFTKNQAAEYGYINGVFESSAGHLRVNVSSDSVKVDYVRTFLPKDETNIRKNRMVTNSYVVKPCVISDNFNISTNQNDSKNSPNPFHQHTKINFSVTEKTLVNLNIYDINGKLIKCLLNNQEYPVGDYEIEWDAKDNDGAQISSGMYLYSLEIQGKSLTKKMINLNY